MSTTTPPAPAAAKKTAVKKATAPAKKATAKKAAAKKTTAPARTPAKKAAAPARPAKKTVPAQRTSAKPAAKKKALAKKTPAKTIGARAMRAAKFAWEHPVLALVGTTAVAGTVLYRGALRPAGKVLAFTGRGLAAAGSWAWDTGTAYVIRRRRSAKPLTGGKHAHCQRCKGTGTLPRHDAHGRFLGSITCTG
ncbi:hypothetical protein ABT095_33670 [Kitasatospora sp. NPDC002227]|uniref:hypothetical protein n=1 Tax=Kitasatospora sp. NPDC002227 TaxID=3154773 RepID=UPI003329CD5D